MKPLRFAQISQCAGKQSYETWANAQEVRRAYKSLDIYRCPHCGQFHLGRKPKGFGRPKQQPPAIELEA